MNTVWRIHKEYHWVPEACYSLFVWLFLFYFGFFFFVLTKITSKFCFWNFLAYQHHANWFVCVKSSVLNDKNAYLFRGITALFSWFLWASHKWFMWEGIVFTAAGEELTPTEKDERVWTLMEVGCKNHIAVLLANAHWSLNRCYLFWLLLNIILN